MALEVYTNDGLGTVSSGGISAPSPLTTETWTVVITQAFPSPTTGQQFHVCDQATGYTLEKITVPAGNSGATGTQTWANVVRGAEGTTPVAHLSGFTIRQVVTGGDFGQFVDETSAQTVAGKTFTDTAETLVTTSSASGAMTVDLSAGNVQQLTLTGNITGFTFSNVPAAGAVSLTLYLVQNGTGGWTVTWPVSITWLGGTAPSLSLAPAGVTEVILQTLNGGTGWYGAAVAGSPPLPLPITSGGTGSVTRNFAGLLTPTAVKNVSNSPVTANPGDLVLVDISAGNVTVNLTAAPAAATALGVKVVATGGPNSCTVNTGGSGGTQDTFDGDGTTSRTLSVLNEGLTAQYVPGGSGPPGQWVIPGNDPQLRARLLTPTAVKTSAYTASPGDLVPVDTTSGAVTVTLPNGPADLTVVGVKMVVQGGTNTVTLNCAGSDVFNKTSGGTSATLTLQSQAMLLQYKLSGGIWYVLSDDLPLTQLDSRYVAQSVLPLPIASGGTAATTAAAAITSLGAVDTTTTQSIGGTKTFTGEIVVPTPANAGDAVTKAYADAIAQGLSTKFSVQEATTAALPANTYSNGASGVGATLSGVATGVLTVNGQTVALNDRVLVQNEATASHNGIYTCTTAGATGVAYILTRATDMNTASQVPGAYTFVEQGTTNGSAGFTVSGAGPFTIGTTAINWTQFSGAGEITPGTGLSKTGNTLALVTPVSLANGGTGQSSAAAAFNALSPMTTLGDIEYESGANTASRLAGNTTAAKNFLTQTGTGSVSAAPAWAAIAAADLPSATTSAQGAVILDGTAGDIQPLGTQSAGGSVTTKSAYADHVHQGLGTWTPASHGLQAWAFDPVVGASSATLTATTGQIYLIGMQLGVAVSITSLWVVVTVAATSVSAAQIGLYSSSGSRLVAVSFTSQIVSTTVAPVTCSSTSCGPGLVWLAFFYTGSGTNAQLLRAAAPGATVSNLNLSASASRFSQYAAAAPYSSLPSSITTASITTLSSAIWGGIG